MKRIGSIDALRFAGVAAVVVQHAFGPSSAAGLLGSEIVLGLSLFAVPALFATSGWLSTARSSTSSLGRRLTRLLVPLAVWTVVLLGMRFVRAYAADRPFPEVDWLGVVFAGQGYYTLWFLAMLTYVVIVGWFLRTQRARLVALGACVIAAAVLTVVRWSLPSMPQETWIGFLEIAPVCFGAYLAGAWWAASERRVSRAASGVIAAATAIVCAGLVVTWGTTIPQWQQEVVWAVSLVAGLALLALAADPATREVGFGVIVWAGTFTLGIYVLHAPVLDILRQAIGAEGREGMLTAALLAIVTLAVSLAASFVIALARPLRPLVK